jgi:hypothetical protein
MSRQLKLKMECPIEGDGEPDVSKVMRLMCTNRSSTISAFGMRIIGSID